MGSIPCHNESKNKNKNKNKKQKQKTKTKIKTKIIIKKKNIHEFFSRDTRGSQ